MTTNWFERNKEAGWSIAVFMATIFIAWLIALSVGNVLNVLCNTNPANCLNVTGIIPGA